MYTYNITHNKHTIHINTHMMYIQNTYNNIYTIYIIHNWWCSDIYPGGRGLVGLEQPAAAPAALATLFTRNKSAVAWPRLAGQFVDVWWWEIASRTQSFPVQGTYIYNFTVCIYRLSLYIHILYNIYIYMIYIYIYDISIYTQCMYSYPLIFFDIWAATAGWFDPRPSLPRRCSVDWAATKSFAVLPGTNEAEKASLFLGIWMGNLWGNIQ